jgi:hypothetical protein
MFRKKSRLFWSFALLLFFLVDLFLLWKVGIVSLGELDAYRDVKFEDKERVIPVSESKSDKGHSRENGIENDHGLNCVCKDCRSIKKGRGSLYPINQ